MPLHEVAERVSFADDIRKNKRLSELIQRELKSKRGSDIARYLTTQEERFFNSLVVAVYRGKPEWHEFGNITPQSDYEIDIEDIPDETRFSVGFLSFNGKERLLAVDGQHRLAGMKEAMKESGNEPLRDDQVPLIVIGHNESPEGLERTRRLFTTLNKTAKPVSKGEIIALDEDDVMAICVRRLVEQHKFFQDDRVCYRATNNLPVNDATALTTIGNLYDVLGVLFSRVRDQVKLKELQFNRPGEASLQEFYDFAIEYFERLSAVHGPLREFLGARKNTSGIVKKYRGDFGGDLLYRPIGLRIATEVIAELCQSMPLKDACKEYSKLPSKLDEPPFAGLVWDADRSRMSAPISVPLTRDVLLVMLGKKTATTSLNNIYAKALGRPGGGAELLAKLPKVSQS